MEDDDDIPDGCLNCNNAKVASFLATHGVDPDAVFIFYPGKVLSEHEELVEPCGICASVFYVDWSRSDVLS